MEGLEVLEVLAFPCKKERETRRHRAFLQNPDVRGLMAFIAKHDLREQAYRAVVAHQKQIVSISSQLAPRSRI